MAEQLRKHSRAGRSQTAFSAKTLRAAGLLSVAGVDSFLTARSGDARVSPPWAQPKSLAAAPLVVSKQALSRIMLPFACALLLGAAGAEAATFTVNTTNDTSDADLADGICADINGKCSLRAAIMQANYTNVIGTSNTIIVPAGVYKLTRPGDDDSAVIGDLDIAQTMTIQGAGSSPTIVDRNRAMTCDRRLQTLSSAQETTLSGMTIRNGSKVAGTFDSGGGLYWDGGGGHLHLSDLIVEGNASPYGGGIYLNYSSDRAVLVLDHVILRNHTVSAAAAGRARC